LDTLFRVGEIDVISHALTLMNKEKSQTSLEGAGF
jgi:hypothetical protein